MVAVTVRISFPPLSFLEIRARLRKHESATASLRENRGGRAFFVESKRRLLFVKFQYNEDKIKIIVSFKFL